MLQVFFIIFESLSELTGLVLKSRSERLDFRAFSVVKVLNSVADQGAVQNEDGSV